MLCKRPVSALCLFLKKVDSQIALNVKLSNSFKNYGKTKIQPLIEAHWGGVNVVFRCVCLLIFAISLIIRG